MQPDEQNIWKLITRVLSGEAGSSEKKKFDQWLKEDPSNRAFFEKLQTQWKEEPDKNTVHNRLLFDHESGISKLRFKIREEKENNAFQVAPPPARKTNRFAGWAIAASVLLLIGIVSAWAGIQSWNPKVKTYETSNLEQRIITLPDRSTVRLNKNSAISFAGGLSESTRKLTLKGEAFFNVAHDAERPFIIYTGDAIVRDIGTSFNVKQQNDGKIVVAMKEGRATLRAKNSSSRNAAILTENNIGILDQGQVATITQPSIQNYLSWMNGRLVFKDMPLDKVIRQLDHIYGIRSSLEDSSLATLNLTAYTKNTSLDEVLDMIALSLEIEYRKEGREVTWRKKSGDKSESNDITDTTVTKA